MKSWGNPAPTTCSPMLILTVTACAWPCARWKEPWPMDGDIRTANIYLHHKDGHRVPISVRTNRLVDDKGNVLGGIKLFTDRSNQTANELRIQELEKMALLDKRTELPNRHYLESVFL